MTGGPRGIGAAIASALAETGADVVFPASPAASLITGAILTADGGAIA